MSVYKITSENFKEEVLESNKPVLVDFWASWCGPCKMMGPIVDKIGEENNDIKVCKINIDEQRSLAMKYGIMSIPTFMVFNEGKVVNKTMGAMPKEKVLSLVK